VIVRTRSSNSREPKRANLRHWNQLTSAMVNLEIQSPWNLEFSCVKKRRHFHYRSGNANKQSKFMRCLRRKLSGASSIEFMGCVFSFWAASFWLCHFTMLSARHSGSQWASTPLTTALSNRTWTSSASTEFSSAANQRTTSHGTSSQKQSSWL